MAEVKTRKNMDKKVNTGLKKENASKKDVVSREELEAFVEKFNKKHKGS